MEIRYEKHWSGWLNRDMEFKIYGSCGKPVIFIPCQAASTLFTCRLQPRRILPM